MVLPVALREHTPFATFGRVGYNAKILNPKNPKFRRVIFTFQELQNWHKTQETPPPTKTE
jgi:hypothetical protein